MYAARHWGGVRLSLFLLAIAAGWVAVFLSLKLGTYRGSIENLASADMRGHWSPGFASNVAIVVLVLAVVTGAWATIGWIAGRKERNAVRAAVDSGHRPLLM